jgi:hypothetical protein
MAKGGFDLVEWAKQHSPIPADETAEYQAFANAFFGWMMVLPVCFAYLLCYLGGNLLLGLGDFFRYSRIGMRS